MKTTLLLTIPALILTAAACKKSDKKTTPDAVDAVVGNYAGTMHVKQTSSYHSGPYIYTDTSYAITVAVSKVSADSFTVPQLFSVYFYDAANSLTISQNVPYNSSGLYSSYFGPTNGYDTLILTPSADSIYATSHTLSLGNGGNTLYQSTTTVFTGKK